MKYFVLSLLLCSLFIFSGCPEDDGAIEILSEPVIVTTTGRTGADNNLSEAYSNEEEEIQPKIDLSRDSSIIQIVNENLDIDQIEEQIIAYRPGDLPGTPIHLLVADYDAIQDSYFPAWETVLDITNGMSFALSFIDLVGDHIPEIVCTGTDSETGSQLMRVYRKSISPSGFGLFFSEVCSLSVHGSIQITQMERDQAYFNGQKNGKSFPIVTHEQDRDSSNLSDLIKTTYYWRYQDNAYVQVMREKVYGEKIEDERLSQLFRSGEKEFEDFLQGPWLKSTQDSSGRVSRSILYFDRSEDSFSIFSGDIQEEYLWQASNRTNYNQLYLIGANELIRFIRKQLSITVRDMNNIYIWTNDTNDTWGGDYQRVSGDISHLFRQQQEGNALPDISLSGVFSNDSGESIVFDEPWFQFRNSEGERKGGYALYISGSGIGQNIVLEFKYLTDAGLVEERQVYKTDYMEELRGDEIIRTLVLIPGQVSIFGFQPSESGYLQYEQIETIDTDSTDSGKN